MAVADVDTTSPRVDASRNATPTQAISADDWLVPEPEVIDTVHSETAAEKSSASVSAPDLSATANIPSRKVAAPIRKDSFVIRFPDRKIKLLQQWECIVLGVRDGYVACELHDLTDESQPVEYAEILVDEFHEYDRPLLTEGAVFYWSVGRETNKVGTIRRYSDLRVRRIPPLSKLKKSEIAAEAEHLSELLKSQFKR